jgi:hypothetical protein
MKVIADRTTHAAAKTSPARRHFARPPGRNADTRPFFLTATSDERRDPGSVGGTVVVVNRSRLTTPGRVGASPLHRPLVLKRASRGAVSCRSMRSARSGREFARSAFQTGDSSLRRVVCPPLIHRSDRLASKAARAGSPPSTPRRPGAETAACQLAQQEAHDHLALAILGDHLPTA